MQSVQIPEHVRYLKGDDYGVLLNIRTGRFHGLNKIAADLLEIIRAGGDVAHWAAAVASMYNVPLAKISADADSLISELLQLGVLERRSSRNSQRGQIT